MKPIPMRQLLEQAREKGRAVPAFNIDNLESALAAAEVLRERGVPLIIQTIPRTLRYGGVRTYPALMDALTERGDAPYALHLDHGTTELVPPCLLAGFSSVMYDGSALPLIENIDRTAEIVSLCKPYGITVEGELGVIGGKEEGDTELEGNYTKTEDAVLFCERTGVDALAVGVGTAHGIYHGTPRIKIDRIAEIRAAAGAFLVLHGASGLSDAVLKDCVRAGIGKINFATEIRQAFTSGLKQGMEQNPEVFDPKIYLRPAIDAIKQIMLEKIDILA